MSQKNSNLHSAKKAKNDEFYTKYKDVNNEVNHYRDLFRDKVVYLNCDSAKSQFYNYFKTRFSFLGLKFLVATHYDGEGGAYKITFDGNEEVREFLKGDGDFRSPECVEILRGCDVVVTNPPFSLFREYIGLLVSMDKKFLVIGSKNAISYKEIFPLIQDNQIWIGVNLINNFTTPSGEDGSAPACWFTNLSHYKRKEELKFYREYTPEEYPTYQNYGAIEVKKVSDIPVDFKGVMGVPITFLMKHNPDQFSIVGFRKGVDGKDLRYSASNGKVVEPYFRILIQGK